MNAVESRQGKFKKIAKRNTPQRALVLEVVRSLRNHPTSSEVFQEASLRRENISKATVYRNLDVLVQAGQLRKIEMPERAARYDATLTPHGHAYCRICGSVHDVYLSEKEDITQLITENHGFAVEGYRVVFDGVCEVCTEKKGLETP